MIHTNYDPEADVLHTDGNPIEAEITSVRLRNVTAAPAATA